jgi:tetratricopeptide (TPR) repeat protein
MHSTDDLLKQCRQLFGQGERDRCLSLAQSRNTKDLHDPALHLAWADLLEELGLVEEVILELNLALRDAPEGEETYARLAEIYLDQGKPLQAAHLWDQLAKRQPHAARAYRELGRALEEAQEFDKARQVYQLALDKTGESHFQTLLKHLGFLEETPEPPPPSETPEFLPQPHHLVTFLSLFSGREGVYARQWLSPTGEAGYTPIQEPLTPKVAENHILGNFTVGVYPVRLDNTVNFLAFDLDVAKFAVKQAITSQRAGPGSWPRCTRRPAGCWISPHPRKSPPTWKTRASRAGMSGFFWNLPCRPGWPKNAAICWPAGCRRCRRK